MNYWCVFFVVVFLFFCRTLRRGESLISRPVLFLPLSSCIWYSQEIFYTGLFAGRLVEGDLCSISVAANAQIGPLLNDYHCNHSLPLSLCAASQMHRNSRSCPSRMMIHPFQAPCSRTTGAHFLMTATEIASLKSFEQCVAGRRKQRLTDC